MAESRKGTFLALELSLELISSLRGVLDRLGESDPKLRDQARDAASSVALNLAEGRRRQGKDRRYLWCVAAGSADEVRMALRVARAWGTLGDDEIEDPLRRLDRLIGILWGLTH